MKSLRLCFLVEMFATLLFVFAAIGGPVFGSNSSTNLGDAIGLGLIYVVLASLFGGVLSCQMNPALTIALLLRGRLGGPAAAARGAGQLIGGLGGGALAFAVATGQAGYRAENYFAANGWGNWSPKDFGIGATVITELVLVAVLGFVALRATATAVSPLNHRIPVDAILVGMTMTVAVGLAAPVDNAALNPARSLGAAPFSGGHALGQLWLFFVAPIVGAGLAAFLDRLAAAAAATVTPSESNVDADSVDAVVGAAADAVESVEVGAGPADLGTTSG